MMEKGARVRQKRVASGVVMTVKRVTDQGYVVCTWSDPVTRLTHERMFFPDMLEPYPEQPGAKPAAASNHPIAPVEPTHIPSAQTITQSREPVPNSPAEAVAALKLPPDTEDGDSPPAEPAPSPSADQANDKRK